MFTKNTFSLLNIEQNQSQKPSQKDRYIPKRQLTEQFSLDFLHNISPNQDQNKPINFNQNQNTFYTNLLKKNLFHQTIQQNIPTNYQDNQILYPTNFKKKRRKIDSTPFKVLDASMLQDDYYINVLDWSSQNNIGVGLSNQVFIWNFQSNKITTLQENILEDFISCVRFDKHSENLVIGSFSGRIDLYDFERLKKINTFAGNNCRVGTASLKQNLLLTGNKEGEIFLYDIRVKDCVKEYIFHEQEICGLEWSPCGEFFASGGNENKLYVFSNKMEIPIMKKTHKAAIRAIGWSPFQRGILATGAGTADRHLRIWNINTKTLINQVDTESQICSLVFSKKENEIITAHGFSMNEINIWRGKRLEKVGTLKGHSQRVLYLAMDPKGDMVVSGAGDETLRFWDLAYGKEKILKNEFGLLLPQILRQLIFLYFYNELGESAKKREKVNTFEIKKCEGKFDRIIKKYN